MEQRLGRDWVKKGKINVIDMDHDYFLVYFSDEEDYSFALTGGSWMIAKVETFLLGIRKRSEKIAATLMDKINIKSTDMAQESQRNQRPPNFGPWMMVRRQIRKKPKRLIMGKKSIAIRKESFTVTKGEDTKTGHLNKIGLRYNILYEDAEIEGNINTIHASEKQQTKQDEPRLPNVPRIVGQKPRWPKGS
ncbi:hypothetical protein Ahy_A08g038697 [Arachis hypogaea]|uniref:DUF4283 domain-containing protein n=1 Tax=Arachis hypogaea TaxID=3818 RepID=A0A445BUD8_ARAHY|nr:hypothetical protein Ahy_A08g038697 [Arachis hypogaea]